MYVVARNFFLLLLNCSAWPCLGPAKQNKNPPLYVRKCLGPFGIYAPIKKGFYLKEILQQDKIPLCLDRSRFSIRSPSPA